MVQEYDTTKEQPVESLWERPELWALLQHPEIADFETFVKNQIKEGILPCKNNLFHIID